MSDSWPAIAIVGESLILPRCHTSAELWQLVAQGESAIGEVPAGYWRLEPDQVVRPAAAMSGDHAYCAQGGYVTSFAWHPERLTGDRAALNHLDPLCQWSLTAAQQLLDQVAGVSERLRDKTATILGNLSYPTPSHSQLYEQQALHQLLPDKFPPPEAGLFPNRYGSSLPSQLIKQQLRLGGEAFSIDAACASTLYAVKLACDQLHQGRADLLLVGGVNHVDSLFLHVGFSALKALSPSGQSRPFHRDADGLLPAEGVAMVALKRLEDALNHGDTIIGLIRGIGLSNDGRSGGFLSPAKRGQVVSMQQAYASCGIDPASIGFVECHATGTATGDAVEIASLAEIFGRHRALAIGSLKANIGHLITASGGASLIKVLQGFGQQQLPYMPPPSELTPELAATRFYLPSQRLSWPAEESPRRAAVNNFGFGGNNAHLILEEWNPAQFPQQLEYVGTKVAPRQPIEVALVAMAANYGNRSSLTELAQELHQREQPLEPFEPKMSSIRLRSHSLGFPPHDLAQCLTQQTLLLELLDSQHRLLAQLDGAKTGLFIAMEVAPEINRVGLRLRLNDYLQQAGITLAEAPLKALKDQIYPALTAARVVGCMPNIPANRLNNRYHFTAEGFTLSAAAESAAVSLNYALQQIGSGALESAIVGVIDIADEVLSSHDTDTDGAVVWILCRASVAQQRQLPYLTLLPSDFSLSSPPPPPLWGC
ncbi:polyketide synthase [Ectothiorhodospiraceae bacterium BW-2]|nr:polyketide synthase [Ectothiorhodospiraceae bacterium BW-2]